HQGTGAHVRNAHVRAAPHVGHRRPRVVPHGVLALRRGAVASSVEDHRDRESRAGRSGSRGGLTDMSKRAALYAHAAPPTGPTASAAAAYTHYHLIHDPAYHSFCDVSETISCTQVYQSRFSTVAGVPVALFGAIAFVAAALLAVVGLAARQEVRENVPSY